MSSSAVVTRSPLTATMTSPVRSPALAAGPPAVTAERALRAPVPPGQVLAIRNACPAAEGRDSDLEAARALIHDPATYAAALLPQLRDRSETTSVVIGPSLVSAPKDH